MTSSDHFLLKPMNDDSNIARVKPSNGDLMHASPIYFISAQIMVGKSQMVSPKAHWFNSSTSSPKFHISVFHYLDGLSVLIGV